jgi:hypothetical protein
MKLRLSEANAIADNPASFSAEQWLNAYIRLATPQVTARMRNVTNERTLARYTRRMQVLTDHLVTAGFVIDGRNIRLGSITHGEADVLET